jgi:hypothetical protein
MRIKYDWMQLN